jgi:glycosyltransferase involved in cell wall biosynthesis
MDAWNSVRPEAEMFIEMAKLGHKVTIVTQGQAEYVKRFKDNGLKVIDSYPKRKICFDDIKTLRHEMRHDDYDIVYAMNSKTIPNAAFACIGFKAKCVAYRGTVGGLYRHDPSAYLTQLHPRVDGVSCVAKAVQSDIKKQVWKNKDNVVAIYKGHDPKWFQDSPSDLSEFGITKDDFVAICVANARPSKGVSVLLEAVNQLAQFPNFHLLLVGRDLDKSPYTELVANSAMKDRIHVAGYRNDVPGLMAASNLQLQPSISGEGLPKTIIEGMAYALPSIVTTTGGSPELVKDGDSGYVVATNDIDALANKMKYCIENPEITKEMGLKAQQIMHQNFTLEKTVEKHLQFFESLIKQ